MGGSNSTWNKTTFTTNKTTGYFKETNALSVGTASTSNLRYITEDALIKFTPPSGKYIHKTNGTLTSTSGPATTDVLWTKIVSVEGDGSNGGLGDLASGVGPIVLNDLVPDTAVLSEIIPQYDVTITATLEKSIKEFSIKKIKRSEVFLFLSKISLTTFCPFNKFFKLFKLKSLGKLKLIILDVLLLVIFKLFSLI